MSVNRYDVPAQSVQGLEPFKLPYNELATALLSAQKQRDDELKKASDLKALTANIKSLDPSVMEYSTDANGNVIKIGRAHV